MEIRWPLQTCYLIEIHFILAHLISGQSEIVTVNEKTVYALPGEDVTLTCSILKEKRVHVTQTQWSKVSDVPARRIAVYHPHYGTIYSEKLYNYSASFREDSQHCMPNFSHFMVNYEECNQWVLQFKNVSLEISGDYECSFTTFPAGTSSSKISLVVRKIDVKSSVVEVLLNQTLEIPCLIDLPSVDLTNASLTWLLKENRNEEILINKPFHQSISRAMIFKDRIEMNSENTLVISPVSVFDDGKKFICSVTHHPGRTTKTTTEVKVFVKPEISISLHSSFTGKATLTCTIKRAFPKPNLLWYLNGEILKGTSEGIIIETEDAKVAGGFYEMKSLLTTWKTKHPSLRLAFKCMSLYPFPGNETQNISSEHVLLPYGWQPTTMEALKTNSRVTPSLNSGTESQKSSATTTQKTSIHVTRLHKNITASQRNLFTGKTELTRQMNHDNLRITNGPYNNTGNLTPKTAVELTTLVSPNHLPTMYTKFNNNGTVTHPGHIYFSWPALVATLLFFCTFLILLGVRKWCQYQKEIMNRPPSFKPPPPPVKYTSMQGLDGIYTSCNALENL